VAALPPVKDRDDYDFAARPSKPMRRGRTLITEKIRQRVDRAWILIRRRGLSGPDAVDVLLADPEAAVNLGEHGIVSGGVIPLCAHGERSWILAIDSAGTLEELRHAYDRIVARHSRDWLAIRRRLPSRPRLRRRIATTPVASVRFLEGAEANDIHRRFELRDSTPLLLIDRLMPASQLRAEGYELLRRWRFSHPRPKPMRFRRERGRAFRARIFMSEHPKATTKDLARHLDCSAHAAKRARHAAKKLPEGTVQALEDQATQEHWKTCTACLAGLPCRPGEKLLNAAAGAKSRREQLMRHADAADVAEDDADDGGVGEGTDVARGLVAQKRRRRH
jgi:hypothetical protein